MRAKGLLTDYKLGRDRQASDLDLGLEMRKSESGLGSGQYDNATAGG